MNTAKSDILIVLLLIILVVFLVTYIPIHDYNRKVERGKASFSHNVHLSLSDVQHAYDTGNISVRRNDISGSQYWITCNSTYIYLDKSDYRSLFAYIDTEKSLNPRDFLQATL